MKVEIIEHYAEDDPTFFGECVVDLIVNGKVIYGEQDEYHNKIYSKIEGFLDCLRHLNIDYQIVKTQIADCSLLND